MRSVCIILSGLLLASCGGPADLTNSGTSSSSSEQSSSTAPIDSTEDWEEYVNDLYWLVLKHPPEYTAKETSSNRRVPPTSALKGNEHPPAFHTYTFSAPGKTSFALSIFRGVDSKTSVADLTYDPRCSLQAVDKIELSRVYVVQNIRFVEKRQEVKGKIDIDFCFLNRQRHVLSLHAWGVDPAEADEIHELLRQVQKTLVLYRWPPSRKR
jgi:hypothetical protein